MDDLEKRIQEVLSRKMSDFKVGDKVYLECKVTHKDASDNTYQIRYKNWHDNELPTDFVKNDVLHSVNEPYNQGLNDAWELAKKIVLPDHLGGYTVDELKDIFGKNTFASLMNTFSPQEALAKVKAYEEHNEIKVGDVVRSKGCNVEGIITKISEIKIYRLFKDGSCDSISTKVKEDLDKTGKHFDSIDEFMKS